MGRWAAGLKAFARKRTGLFLAAGLALLVAGCEGGPEVIKKAEVKSPDGYWTVTTQLERWSGPGNNALASTVYISRTADHDKPELILSLDIQNQDLGDVVVTWRDKDHLKLVYRNDLKVNFQVVKYAGLDISAMGG
jgi:hypothetical protein